MSRGELSTGFSAGLVARRPVVRQHTMVGCAQRVQNAHLKAGKWRGRGGGLHGPADPTKSHLLAALGGDGAFQTWTLRRHLRSKP